MLKCGFVAVLSVAGALAGPLRSARALNIECLAIIGKNDKSGIDKRIPKSVVNALTRSFRYKSYALHSAQRKQAGLKGRATFDLSAKYTLVVEPLDARGRDADRRIYLRASIVKGTERILAASVWLRPGRYWVFGGPSADGGALILALAVTE